MIEFDRIVAYGCSMTCGDETLDHIFVDALTEYEVDKTKIDMGGLFCPNWNATYYTPKYCSDKTLFDQDGKWLWGEQMRRTKEVAWPRWLADKFGVPWINKSIGGAGIEYAIYRYEEDLATGQINDSDLVLFGLTTPHRWFWIDETGLPRKPLLSFPADWPSPKFHSEYVASIGNTFQCYWDYYLQLRHIDSLYHRSNGRVRAFHVTNSHDNAFRWFENMPNYQHTNLYKIASQVYDFESIMKLDYYFKSYEYTRDWAREEPHPLYCGFGHPKISEHQVMAQNIYEYLINE